MVTKIPVEWPRPVNVPELRAARVARLIAEREHRDWRHEAAGDIRIGVHPFWIPVTSGHVAEMMRGAGATEDEIEGFLTGDLPDERIADLYRTAREWVVQAIDDAAAFGVALAVWPRIARPSSRGSNEAGAHVHRHIE